MIDLNLTLHVTVELEVRAINILNMRLFNYKTYIITTETKGIRQK